MGKNSQLHKKAFERVIYLNCVVLAMSNNIKILDDRRYVFREDKPSIGILRGLNSVNLKIMVQKFLNLLFLFEADRK